MDIVSVLKSIPKPQAEIAKRLGVTQPTVSRWSSGDLTIDKRTEIAIRALAGEMPEPPACHGADAAASPPDEKPNHPDSLAA